MKTYKVHCIVRDSLGEKVAEYDTKLNCEDYRRLMSIAELDNDSLSMIAVRDIEVDGELGWREYWLN